MSTTRNKVFGALIIAIIAVSIVAAIGWLRPVENVIEEVPVEVSLEDLAKKEGQLTVYAAVDTPDFENFIKPAFLKIYPWATVNYVGMDSGDVASRTISEYKAGHVTADVLMNALGSLTLVVDAGAAQNFTNPMVSLMHYPNGTFDPAGYWHPSAQFPVVIFYNTNLVAPDDVPKNYTDLTDPKWNGEIALEDPSTVTEVTLLFSHMYPIMGNASWTSWMNGIADNNPVITSGGGDTFQKVVSGEVSLGIGLINDYLSAPPGTPIGLAWMKPAISMFAPALVTKNAPHPAMARLFVEWLSSADGEYAFAATGRPPAHPSIAATTSLAGVLPSGYELVAGCSNNLDFFVNPGKWSDLYRSIFHG